MIEAFNTENKTPAEMLETFIGMGNAAVGMFSGGEHDLNSLIAKFQPKIVEGIAKYEASQGKKYSIMLMLDDESGCINAGLYDITSGNAEIVNSWPLNDIIGLLRSLVSNAPQNQSNDTIDQIQPAAQIGTADAGTETNDDNGSATDETGSAAGSTAGTGDAGPGADTSSTANAGELDQPDAE